MSYNSVGTPRFYIDQYEYLKAIGLDTAKWYEDNDWLTHDQDYMPGGTVGTNNPTPTTNPNLFNLNPTVQETLPDYVQSSLWRFNIPTGYTREPLLEGDNIGRYVAILNHNLKTINSSSLTFNWVSAISGGTFTVDSTTPLGLLNYDSNVQNDGCTIFELDKSNNFNPQSTHELASISLGAASPGLSTVGIGAISTGVYFDMNNSPELDVQMSIEYDGADTITTTGGGSITNINYTGNPWWYDINGNKREPWAIGSSNGITKRTGRRTWNLKFKYYDQKNLFASNYMTNTYLETPSEHNALDIDYYNWGSNMITNSDFETGTGSTSTDGAIVNNWTLGYNSGLTSTHATMDTSNSSSPLAGTNDLKFTNTGTDTAEGTHNLAAVISNGLALVQGVTYYVAFRYKTNYNASSQKNPLKVKIAGASNHPGGGDISGGPANTGGDGTAGYGWQQMALTATTSTFYETIFTYSDADQTNYLTFFSGNADTSHDFEAQIDDVEFRAANPSDFQYTIDDDNSLSAQVLQKIGLGQKFLFQPNNKDFNPSSFAICTLDQDSLKVKQVANRVYDFSLKISEVW